MTRDELIDALLILGTLLIIVGTSAGIGIQVARYFKWGCG